jgi:hypothetical protein
MSSREISLRSFLSVFVGFCRVFAVPSDAIISVKAFREVVMKIKLCEQYSFLRLLSLKEELSVLPNVKPGILRGRPIVRLYYKNNRGRLTYKTYSEENDEGKRYFRIAARRAEIKDEIASIESALGKSLFGKLSRFSVKTGGSILNEELWNTAGNDENPIEKRGSYYHNGIQMRSRT